MQINAEHFLIFFPATQAMIGCGMPVLFLHPLKYQLEKRSPLDLGLNMFL
jgi:hypothetical protein